MIKITLVNVCAVLWRSILSTVKNFQHCGGYHQYYGGAIFSTVKDVQPRGDIISTVEGAQYCERFSIL